jgi:hypothetical protein
MNLYKSRKTSEIMQKKTKLIRRRRKLSSGCKTPQQRNGFYFKPWTNISKNQQSLPIEFNDDEKAMQ